MKTIVMRLEVQKYQHFFIAEDAFLLSHYCIKPCSKKNLTNEEVLLVVVSLEIHVSLTMLLKHRLIDLGYLQAVIR